MPKVETSVFASVSAKLGSFVEPDEVFKLEKDSVYNHVEGVKEREEKRRNLSFGLLSLQVFFC